MSIRILSLVLGVLALAGCQTADPIGYTANKQHGYAQMATGGFGPSADQADVAEVAEVAQPAKTEQAPVAAAPVAKADCAKPSALSAAAAGQPCMTTEAFIKSLNLPEAQAAAALSQVAKARKAAH